MSLPMFTRSISLRIALAMSLAFALGNCAATSSSPRMAVVGVEGNTGPSEPITLFLEVVNPTSVPLVLRKLSYQIESENAVHEVSAQAVDRGEPAGFFSQMMSVTSSRTVLPGTSVFIEVPAVVPAAVGSQYTLHSTLEAVQNNQRRKFKMESTIADLGRGR